MPYLVGYHKAFGASKITKSYFSSEADRGISALGIFLKSPRAYHASPYPSETVDKFNRALAAQSVITKESILPHVGYLVNIASATEATRNRSIASLKIELNLAAQLELPHVNMHMGTNANHAEGLQYVVEGLDQVYSGHGVRLPDIMMEIETGKNKIGNTFEELRKIYDASDYSRKLSVCLDTCHMFTAGYDIRGKQGLHKVIDEFDDVVGLDLLKGIHLNESSEPFNSHKDRHAKLNDDGRGQRHIGTETFEEFFKMPEFQDMPIILERDTTLHEDELEYVQSLM